MRLTPDFLIIGAQRSGTSSLYDHLTRHPQVAPAVRKEVHFFDDKFTRGLRWYRAHFPSSLYRYCVERLRGHEIVTGEASPYYLFHPAVPRRVSQTAPGLKLIILLRNPVDRAYSHYNHECRMGRECLPFEEAIERETERLGDEAEKLLDERIHFSLRHRSFSYLARGIYVDQLEAWERFFPRERMLILQSESFYSDPPAALRQVFRFLDLPAWEPESYPKLPYPRYENLDPTLRKRLTDYFEPHNRRLFAHLGRELDWQ
jgi:hypothetical protein